MTVSGGGEINTSNNTDTDPTTVVQADLTIAKSHSGNFTQGQTGAQYSIIVTNAGSASTNGTTVTVTDTLPTGLTATAISGTGWSLRARNADLYAQRRYWRPAILIRRSR